MDSFKVLTSWPDYKLEFHLTKHQIVANFQSGNTRKLLFAHKTLSSASHYAPILINVSNKISIFQRYHLIY